MFHDIRARAERYAHEVWEDVVSDIAALVAIRSVEDLAQAAPGMPWGPGPRAALDAGLALCERLGMEPTCDDGYIGWADLPGASPTQVATIAHTDVVPEGLGWTSDPYAMERHDGYLVGRGVLDDKGPFVLSAYAIHFFKRLADEADAPLPYTLRCIVGNCEETTMADVQHYLAHQEAPAFCFSPDADFPIICGEKGIFHGVYESAAPCVADASPIAELDGGTVSNAIPGQATALVRTEVPAEALSLPDGLEAAQEAEGLVRVTAHGIGGHAAFPEGTKNAIGMLVRWLLDSGTCGEAPDQRSFLQLVELLTRSSDGGAVGIASADEVFGATTLNAGVVRTTERGTWTITVDVRYPSTLTGEGIVGQFEALAEAHGARFEPGMDKAPFYMDPALPEVQALLSSYHEVFGRDDEPVVIGGGTYARQFPRAVAFGPHDPQHEDPAWVGIEHGPDEGVSEDVLQRALVTYIVSIAKLMQLDLAR